MNPIFLLLLPLGVLLSVIPGGIAAVPCSLVKGRRECLMEQKHKARLHDRAPLVYLDAPVAAASTFKRVRRNSCQSPPSSGNSSSTEAQAASQPLASSSAAPSSLPPASTPVSSSSPAPAVASASQSSAAPPPASSAPSPSSSDTTSSSAPAPSSSAPSSSQPASSGAVSVPAASQSVPVNTSQSDINEYLSDQNSVRAQHGAAPLTWSDELAAAAQYWSNGCKFEHSGGSLGPYGENLAAGTGSSYAIDAAISSWTSEVSQYDSSDPQPSHFTQVVWKGTTAVGCAVQECNGIFPSSYGSAKYYVCEYYPQGNVIGEFGQNVQA